MQGDTRSTVAIWLVAGALAVFAAVRLFGGHEAAPPPVRVGGTADSPRAGSPTDERPAPVYVHVAGAVRRPGLIRLDPDSRVATALERVGGPTRRADLTMVNLAAKVQDGQQIVVPLRSAAAAPSSQPTRSTGAQIHLSTATVEQLEEIDGIGPTLAGRIVEYRDSHGVRSIGELTQVDGIGEKRLAALRDALQP